MKSFYICLLAAVAFLTGCDSVGSDERLIEVPAATVQRNVLIEDFTGQRCIFCPDAAEAIAQQQKLYGADKLIAVAFHAGPLAIKSGSGFVGLRTDVGDTYYKYWAVPNVPKAIINRREATTRQVEIETDLKTLAEDVKGKLQLWLVEDSVVAPQLYPNNKVEKEYVHNHVFRAAINGEWGTELMLSAKGIHKEKTAYTLPEDVVAKNAWIVGFFYNDSRVLQAVRQKVSLS